MKTSKTSFQKKQDHDLATYAPLLKKEDGLIDFSHSAEDIYNLVRGVDPWPGAWCYLGEERLKIWKTEIVNFSEEINTNVGEIISLDGPIIRTGNGYLRLLEVQLPRCWFFTATLSQRTKLLKPYISENKKACLLL